MPVALQDAIQSAGYKAATDPLRRFIIAIAEHMVEAIVLLQWGSRWQADGLHAAWYHTDSQNSFAWAQYVWGAFDELSEIRLFGEQKMLTLARGSVQPMAVQLHMFREFFTIDQA